MKTHTDLRLPMPVRIAPATLLSFHENKVYYFVGGEMYTTYELPLNFQVLKYIDVPFNRAFRFCKCWFARRIDGAYALNGYRREITGSETDIDWRVANRTDMKLNAIVV